MFHLPFTKNMNFILRQAIVVEYLICLSGINNWNNLKQSPPHSSTEVITSRVTNETTLHIQICWKYGLSYWLLRIQLHGRSWVKELTLPSSTTSVWSSSTSWGLSHVECTKLPLNASIVTFSSPFKCWRDNDAISVHNTGFIWFNPHDIINNYVICW